VAEHSHDIDDGFHEIQLSGKQLVFLFMATTVVSVVIFLCGVLVGRGVRAEAAGSMRPDAANVAADRPSPPAASPSPAPASSDAPAPPADSALTYHDRLQRDKPATETLKPPSGPKIDDVKPLTSAATLAQAPAPASAPTPAPMPAAAAAPAAVGRSAAQPGTWAVQVVVLRDRAAAGAVIERLSGKGYPAFIVSPAPGAPLQAYKVQVGRFSERSEAEKIADRLRKEEQFEPFILR
jgi:hypothetical protein